MISLYGWAKREKIAYSMATKLFEAGRIAGAVKDGRHTKVPVTTSAPARPMVRCAICQSPYPQITSSHLKQHCITMTGYKCQFPSHPIVSSEVSEAISTQASGRIRTEEHKANLSASLQGRTAWNKGLIDPYSNEVSESTRLKMSVSHTGVLHTEDAKQKIGDAHRGKKLSQEQIEGMSTRMRDYCAEYGAPFKGKTHREVTKELMSNLAIIREATYSPERHAEIAKKRGDAVRGIKRTDEQKLRYRAARVKWMSENPLLVKDTSGERTIAEWLQGHQIGYVKQFVIEGLMHPFDFFLPDYNIIIEFDGSHHWFRPWFNTLGKSEVEKAAMLIRQRIKDEIEAAFAEDAGFTVIRVRGKADVGDCVEWGTIDEQLEALYEAMEEGS